MSTEMTEYVPLGFEELAAKITRDRMLHFGYTPEQINEAEAEDHARCDWNGDERHCLGEDHKSLHPVADELNATAESVVFVLEYVMRPVAEVRARLVEVEAERDAARSSAEQWLEVAHSHEMKLAEQRRLADVAQIEARDLRVELDRWRTGQRIKGLPQITEVPDGLQFAAALVRAQGTEGGEEHDNLLAEAGVRLRDLSDAARHLLAETVVLRHDHTRTQAELEAWRPVVELVRLVVEHQRPGTPAGPDWEDRRDRLWTSLVAAVDALPGADR